MLMEGRPGVRPAAGGPNPPLPVSKFKELRPGSAGRSEIRILYIFDPRRDAVLLVVGDKAGQWDAWYRTAYRWPRNVTRTT